MMRNARAHAAADGEQGFVAVFVALTLTITLAFAAFTVDFGSWYTRSAEIKRAADAAALAGVVWMPEYDLARDAAIAVATRNGFTNGVNNVTVSVDDVPGNNRQLRVTIRDNKAKQFFSRLVTSNQSIGRSSLAEYVLPVPLGSPENVFGTGNLTLPGQSTTQNFWAAINGYCAGHESGDPRSAYYESYSRSSGSGCNSTTQPALNADDYTPDGYLYAIDVPTTGQSLTLEVYDGSFNTSGSASDISIGGSSSYPQSVTTIFTIYDRNPTPLDASNENLATLQLGAPITVNTNDVTYKNTWKSLAVIPNAEAGRYYIRVQTPVQPLDSRGSNGYALRAYSGASSSACSSTSSSTCPQLFALDAMSIYANIQGAAPTFYLARVDAVHAGKTMRIKLFDIGEGAQTLQILGPDSNPQPFTWSTACNPPTAATGGCSGSASGSNPSLDVSGSGTQPYTGLSSSSKYSDRTLTIDIPLSPQYDGSNGNYWWKIRYTVNASSPPTDRTTWSTNIVGDPVHLLQ